MQERIVEVSALKRDVARILAAVDVPESQASLMAEVLVTSDRWGVHSHGVLRVKRYVECILSGGVQPAAELRVEHCAGAWARADACGGLGIPASVKATALAVSLAKEHGVGMVTVRNSHHFGAAGYYAKMCADQSMAGVAMSTGTPIMAVTGGTGRTIGNNPFSYAVPAGKYGVVMMDVAMSAVADGKIQLARSKGELLAPGCILDAAGQPSVCPEDYLDGGVLLPFGGHKGYGLAVMVECFAGLLSGAAMTTDINAWNETPGKSGDTGHMFMAVDIGQQMPPAAFAARVETLVERLKASPRAPGVERILVPGELERERAAAAADRVSLIESTYLSLREAAEMAGCGLEI